jgi:4-hydroxy-4-methyl-2-oxoglutarate aldolase
MLASPGTLAPVELVRRFEKLNASVISDATGCVGVVAPGLARFSGTGTAVGKAITADCAEGSVAAVFPALEHAQPGDFLCVSAPGSSAYLGDLLLAHLEHLRLRGAVIDGLVRDRDAIARSSLSVFARGLTPANRRTGIPGRSMVAIEIGGVRINPGDWIIADGDGIVVVPPAQAETVLAKAEQLTVMEEKILARVQAGEKLMAAVKAETGR